MTLKHPEPPADAEGHDPKTAGKTAPAPKPPAPPCGCDDPIEGLKQMFVDYAQGKTIIAGRDPATRPVFLRLHGVAHGTFEVVPDLPDDLRVGVFGQKDQYPAWVRFSSDVQPGKPDLKGTCGIGIKLFGVAGEKIMAPDEAATTHDFLLQNMDVFFVDTAADMCEFTCQSLNGHFNDYVKAHKRTGEILDAMEKVVDSVLATPYWSGLPSRFGPKRYVKYKLEPEETPPGDGEPDTNDPFYLRADLHERLRKGGARFRFMVQFQTDEKEMPLDRATVPWSEKASEPVHVATLVLPRQDLDTRGQSAYGENLAFNTWHALKDHEPVGSIADARKVVYRASAKSRRDVNALPLGEPVEPRPADWESGVPYPAPVDQTVVRAAIHPAIGVARVGNSKKAYYVGPQVPVPPPAPAKFYRDGDGALKREAAQFRLYGYNAAGEVVRELTPGWADVKWTVHVANRKASWYEWQIALDIPEAASTVLPLRNPDVKGADRAGLTIDGGAKTIEGTNTQGDAYQFRGQFQGTDVYLGELRTDPSGRLLFLGGNGVSASPKNTPIFDPLVDTSFINAAGWYDDTSDGPVTAEVTIEGRQIPVDPAWVVTAPPNYAPSVVGVRTLYDLLVDLYVGAQWMTPPDVVSFYDDVFPILRRLSGLQWVNKGFATQFGHGAPYPFEDPDFIAKLAQAPPSEGDDIYAELRLQVLHSFRDPDGTDGNQLPWPWVYGDAMDLPPSPSPRQNAAITPTQYATLQAWAAGKFTAGPVPTPPATIDAVPLAQQPATLDRAALEFCLADAFHPGCEVTWPIRHLTMFSAPFRIRHRPAGVPEPDYGPTLTPAVALSAKGPLYMQGPGDLSRWMGLPWQADTAFCRSGYSKGSYSYDPYVPTFWPARVPNQVLTAEDYAIVMNPKSSPEERLAAFTRRALWTRMIDEVKGTAARMKRMVDIFGDMGVVEVREGIPDSPDFPAVMMVESTETPPPAPKAPPSLVEEPEADEAEHPKVALHKAALKKAGWDSQEEADEAPLPVHHARR